MGWLLHTTNKDHRADIKQYADLVDQQQRSINLKNSEERDMLISIIDKYHSSQLDIREAISEIKTVLTTLSLMNR